MAVSSGSLVKLYTVLLHYAVMTVGTPDLSIIVSNPRPHIGETIVLSCIYRPQTSVHSFSELRWWRNETEITNFSCPNDANNTDMCRESVLDDMGDERLSFEADAVFSGNLTISKLQISDNGKYNCIVTTIDGIGNGETQLKVRIPAAIEEVMLNEEGAIVECSKNNISMCIVVQDESIVSNSTIDFWANWRVTVWASGDPNGGVAEDRERYFISAHNNVTSMETANDGSLYCGRSTEPDRVKGEITVEWDLNSGPSCEDVGFVCVQLENAAPVPSLVFHTQITPVCRELDCKKNLILRPVCENTVCSCNQRAIIYHATNLTSADKLSHIDELNITTASVDEVLEEVISITEGEVGSEDVALTTSVLETVVSLKSRDSQVTTDVVTIISNLLGSDPEQLVEAQEKNRSSSKAMRALEQQLEHVDLKKTNGSLKVVKPNLGVEVKTTSKEELQSGITFVSNASSSDGDLSDEDMGIIDGEAFRPGAASPWLQETDNLEAAISVQSYLPSNENSALNSNSSYADAIDLRVAFSVVRNAIAFGSGNVSLVESDRSFPTPPGELRPNTPIVSVTVQGSANLQTNVTTTFKPFTDNDNTTVMDCPICVYWDFDADHGRGSWSSYGCRLVRGRTTNNSLLTCQCNHTSNFAVLMRVHEIKTSQQFHEASRVLSYVGCALSIASLAITLCVYGFSSKLRQKQPNQIFMNICASLLLLYIIFVVVVALEHGMEGDVVHDDGPGDDDECNSPANTINTVQNWCHFLAALVQYFTLTTLSWTVVEGVNMYLLFVRVVNSQIRDFMLKASLFAWGLPALIVIVTGAAARNDYTLQDVCFISLKPQIFGLLTPVGIMILINVIIYITVIVRLSRTLSAKKSSKAGGISETWQRLQKALCIFLLLGLTWAFGYLLLIDHAFNQVFQVVFIVLNSFQGFLIFVIYVLRQPLVRKEMSRCCALNVCFTCCAEHRWMLSLRRSSRYTFETSLRSTSRGTLDTSGVAEQSETTFTSKADTLPRQKSRFTLLHKYF